MAFRRAGLNFAARAFPPFAPPSFPNATAAGFRVSGGSGGAFPVAMSTIIFASWFTSRGRLFGMLPTVPHATTGVNRVRFQTDPLPEKERRIVRDRPHPPLIDFGELVRRRG